MPSKKTNNFIIIGGVLLTGFLLLACLFVRVTGFGGYVRYVPYHLRNPKTLEFMNYPTEKLLNIIEEYKSYKGDPKRYPNYLELGAAVRAISTKEDPKALEVIKDILGTFNVSRKQDVLEFIARSRNRAAIPILCERLKKHANRDMDKWIVDTLIKIDDPSALDCFMAESSKLQRNSRHLDGPGDKVDKAIKRWQDMRDGNIKQVAPFDVDRTRYSMGRTLLEVSSFGGYQFTVDPRWACNLEERMTDTKDHFEFDKYYGFPFNSVVTLKVIVTELSEEQATALADRIKRQNSTFKNMPTMNGNPYTASASKSGGGYFSYCVMKVGNLEVSAELSCDNHYWFMFDVGEIREIFKSFKRGLVPNKKFSVFS